MAKRLPPWLALLCAALCAWLFANGLSTALVLVAAALTPLLHWGLGRFFPPRRRLAPAGRRLTPEEDGDREESFQVRDYAPGDDVRRIHWKLSEKLDRTLVRSPVEEPLPGVQSRPAAAAASGRTPRPLLALLAAAVYAALWGALCDMAALSAPSRLWPLLLGGAWSVVLALLPGGRRGKAALAAAAALGLFLLLGGRLWTQGGMVLLNRLFAASEAVEPYTYQMFATEAGLEALWAVLLPLGLILGSLCGGAAGWRQPWLAVLPPAGLLGAVAYLGVAPRWGWGLFLGAALALLLLGLWREPALPALGTALGVLVLACLLTAALLPGELPALTAWEGEMRDALALETVAYGQRPAPSQAVPTPPPPETAPKTAFYREEDTAAKRGGELLDWAKALPAAAVILLFALLLFLPALWSDRLKKRQAQNRAWREMGDHAAAIQAGFRYTLRWLILGGLPRENVPYSGLAREIGERFSPELRAGYESVLPLWQEAAYSGHAMTEAQLERLKSFSRAAQQEVWRGLSRTKRLLARYVYAL